MNAKSSPSPRLSRFRASEALLVSLALALAPVALRAQGIYESVDAQGHVVYSDQSDVSGAGQGAEQEAAQDDAQSLPRVLHVCWTNCFTLVGEHGVYGRTDGTDESWTVERFTPDAFVLKRHDAPAEWNGYHAEVTYAGQVVNDRLTNVTVDGRLVGDIQMAWGRALDTLPGSDAARDRLAQNGLSTPAGESAPDAGAVPLAASEAPPPLPDDEQPPCAVADDIWTPGHWVWVAQRYYWIAGAWVRPPRPGLLWTPGYWSVVGGAFVFHAGFWGSHVGYYGGINYGYGYFGSGYSGGRWAGGTFVYNTAVTHVNASVIRNIYREPPTEITTSRTSYNAGLGGGTTTLPAAQKRIVLSEPQLTPPPPQQQRMPTALVAPKMVHVVRSPVEHTARSIERHTSVAASPPAHTLSSSTPRPTPNSVDAKPVYHPRPTSLHPIP
jgi:hypothetical protein